MSEAIVGQGCVLAFKSHVTTGSITVEFDAGNKKIVRTTGSFVTDGFKTGMYVYSGSVNNPGPFLVTNVAALELTLETAPVDEGSPAPVTATVTGDLVIGEVTSFKGPGGEAKVIDTTHMGSTRIEKKMGLPDEGQLSIEMNLVPDNEGQERLRSLRASRTSDEFRLTLTDESLTQLSFTAYVLGFSISGGVDEKISASANLEITGAVTWDGDA